MLLNEICYVKTVYELRHNLNRVMIQGTAVLSDCCKITGHSIDAVGRTC